MKIWSSIAFYCLHLLKATVCFKGKVKERYHSLFNISSKIPVTEKLNCLWTLHRNLWLLSQETLKGKQVPVSDWAKSLFDFANPCEEASTTCSCWELIPGGGWREGLRRGRRGSWFRETLLPFTRCFQSGTYSVLSEKALLSRISPEVLELVAFLTWKARCAGLAGGKESIPWKPGCLVRSTTGWAKTELSICKITVIQTYTFILKLLEHRLNYSFYRPTVPEVDSLLYLPFWSKSNYLLSQPLLHQMLRWGI